MRIQWVLPSPLMPARRGMSVRGAFGVGEFAKRSFQNFSWASHSGVSSQRANQLGVVAVRHFERRQAVGFAPDQRAVDGRQLVLQDVEGPAVPDRCGAA